MDAVVDVNYRRVLFPSGGAVAKKPSLQAVWPGSEMVAYRECLKNHAASLGGLAVDGCGEYMPSPAARPSDPTSLECAACGCHRNFHRRVPEAPSSPPRPTIPPELVPRLVHGIRQRREETLENRLPADGDVDVDDDDDDSEDFDDDGPASPMPASSLCPPGYPSSTPHMPRALSTGAPGSASAVASRPPPLLLQLVPQSAPGMGPGISSAAAGAARNKRFRTKFSTEQKQQMQEFSERLGWRLPKRDEALVEESCREICVAKGIFKVWMHNNKPNRARRTSSSSVAAAVASATRTIHPTTPARQRHPPTR